MASATGRAIQAGQAFIRMMADDADFRRSVRNQIALMRRFAGAVRNLGAAMAGFGAAIVAAITPLVTASAHAESAMKRLQLVMGDLFPAAIRGIRRLSSEYQIGFSSIAGEFATFAATFSDMRRELSGEQFLELLSRTSRAVINLSALAGISMEEASARMKSAFTSTGEAVDQFGINLRQAELRAEALRLGLSGNIRTLTEAQKQLIKLSIITRTYATMNFDANRAAFTFNVQLARLGSNLRELFIALGTVTRKVLTPVLWFLNQITRALQPLALILGPIVFLLGVAGAIVGSLGAAFVALAGAIGLVLFALNQYMTLMGITTSFGFLRSLVMMRNIWQSISVWITTSSTALAGFLARMAFILPYIAATAAVLTAATSLGRRLIRGPEEGERAPGAVEEGPIYRFIRGILAGVSPVQQARARGFGPGGPPSTLQAAARRTAATVTAVQGVAGGPLIQRQLAFASRTGTLEGNVQSLTDLFSRVVDDDAVNVNLGS